MYGGMWHGGYRRGRWGLRRPVFFALVAGLLLLAVAGPGFHFFPLFLLIPFLLVPALASVAGAVASGVGGVAAARERGQTEGERKERELLQALDRNGELSPARAALETSMTVAEADRMLSELSRDGHIELRAREGRLAYALWEHDKKGLEEGR